MSVIVVEGPDGAGKTTLIEQARGNQKDRYFVTLRASRYQPNLKTAFEYLTWIRHQRDIDLILDRFHFISDRIYGPILRNEDVFGHLPILFGLERVAMIVYARPPLETIIANVQKEGVQLEGVREQTIKIVQAYDNLMTQLHRGIPIRTYDYTNDLPHSFWRQVWSDVKEKSRA